MEGEGSEQRNNADWQNQENNFKVEQAGGDINMEYYKEEHRAYENNNWNSRQTGKDQGEGIEWQTPPDKSPYGGEGGDPAYISKNKPYNKNWQKKYEGATFERQPTLPGEILTTNVGFGQKIQRMTRDSWGAEKPGARPMIRNPVAKIRFTQTGYKMCTTTEECMVHCRELQKYYMDLGFPDIPYNFMIGGDGVLYHGRGWNKQAERSPMFHRLRKACIDVAYIGDFVDKKIPYEMLAVAADFLKYGLKVEKITPFFQSFTFLSEKKRS